VDPRYDATGITHAFERACRKSGLTHATFHDLRHTVVIYTRRADVDYFCIAASTGHTAMAVFTRYNAIDRHALDEAIRQLHSYMDATDVTIRDTPAHAIETSGMGR